MNSKSQISILIKQKALQLGFSAVGISKAELLEKESELLREWIDDGCHGEMSYMENHFDKRVDPRKIAEGAKSVISVLLNYFPEENQRERTYRISKYAYGKDYHIVLKDKLHQLFDFINKEIHPISGRVFVDSAPVMDKVWAAKSGLGWIGKNTNLISKEFGSFVFIGELIIDLELEYDTSRKLSGQAQDYCGNCTKCIDACPTQALSPYKLDARKCISYLTIEKKGEVPSEFAGQWEDWIFGCDICQDVCPWNRKLKPHNIVDFSIDAEVGKITKTEWESIDPVRYSRLFKNSPLERTKFEGLKRNIDFLKSLKD